MVRTKFADLAPSSMFVSGDGLFKKTTLETIQGVETNARDFRRGDLWLFDDNDEVLYVTITLVK